MLLFVEYGYLAFIIENLYWIKVLRNFYFSLSAVVHANMLHAARNDLL